MSALFGTLILILLVAVVGHGIWLVLAAMFRALSGQEPASTKPFHMESTYADDLIVTARQLDRFRRAGTLDETTYGRLKHLVFTEMQKMYGPTGVAPGTTPAPAPPAPPLIGQPSISAPSQPPAVTVAPTVEPALAPPAPSTAPPAPAPPPQVSPPTRQAEPPRPPVTELLLTFMQERNIRMGELVGSVLILVGATALVISLWQRIAENPVWRIGLFVAVNTLIFGIGWFALRRLRLPLTGRALLIVATLLVPLNFLAISAFSEGSGAGQTVAAVETGAAVLFAVLVLFAGRIVCPPWPGALTLSVMVPALSQLLVRRWVDDQIAASMLQGVAAIPLAAYLVACGWALSGAWSWRAVGRLKAHALFAIVGVGLFASGLTICFAVYKAGSVRLSIRELSPLLALHAVPVLAAGLLLAQRITRKLLATFRTAAIAVAVGGSVLLAFSLAAAWPDPALLACTSVIGFMALAGAGLVFGMPQAYLPAGALGMLAYLITFHALAGRLAWHAGPMELLEALFSAWSGTALCPLAVLAGLKAVMFLRLRRHEDGLYMALVAAAVGGLSLLLLTFYALGRIDTVGATWVYGIYALAALGGAWRSRHPAAAWAGSGLLAVAIVQGLVFRYAPALFGTAHPQAAWQIALLSHATVMTAAGLWLMRRRPELRVALAEPFTDSVLITSAIAMTLIVLDSSVAGAGWLATRTLWVAALWLTIATARMRPVTFTAFQAALAWAALMAATAWAGGRPWFSTLQDPRVFEAWGVALGLVVLAWVALRALAAREGWEDQELGRELVLKNDASSQLESLIAAGLTIGLIILGAYGVRPGIVGEMATNMVEFRAAVDELAARRPFGGGAWLLAAILGVIWSVTSWIQREGWRLLMLVALGLAACLLLARSGNETTASASSLRWWLAAAWVIGSAAMSLRHRLPRLWRDDLQWLRPAAGTEMVVLFVGPIVVLTLYPVLALWAGHPVRGPGEGSMFATMGFATSYCAPLMAVCAAFAARAIGERSAALAMASAATFNFAATIFWIAVPWRLKFPETGGAWLDLIHLNVVALALPAAITIWTVVRVDRQTMAAWRPYVVASAQLATAAVLFTTLVAIQSDLAHRYLESGGLLQVAALLSAAAATLACAQGRAVSFPFTSLYLLGLAGVTVVVDRFDAPRHWVFYGLTAGTAAYTLLIAEGLRRWKSDRARLIEDANEILAIISLVAAGGIVLLWGAEEAGTAARATAQRLGLAGAMLMPAATAALRGDRALSLSAMAAAAVAFAWAWAEPGSHYGDALHRAVMAMMALSITACVLGFGLVKLPAAHERWVVAARQTLPAMLGVTCAVLAGVIVLELVQLNGQDAAQMTRPAIAIVIITVVGLVLTALSWAVLPGRDPLNLTERGRMGYVYAAEVLLAVLFLHIRLTMPWLFRGYIQPYWPLIVMAIAFTGVGLGEFFRRRNHTVLASPLERTGALLPLLPVLGFWFASDVHYSVQLVLVGMLYAVLSVTRRSFGFGLMAALAANGGLWYFLHDTEGFTFAQHPQVWLIPFALAVLAAAQMNRQNLDVQQLGLVRYTCLLMIYVSSTADIFIAGVGDSPWLPLVLTALSVAGILGGMAWRVRSFLYLGCAFLLLSLLTIIAHAAERYDAGWLWWAALISAGLGIISLFAVFEKQRSRMLQLVHGLREWDV